MNEDASSLLIKKAAYPSIVVTPGIKPPYPTLLEFFTKRFPRVPREVWERRIAHNEIFDENMIPISLSTPFRCNMKLFYYRQSSAETTIPFLEEILFENEHLLVAYKPHFLPSIPGGRWVNECLLYRLREKTGLLHLVPLHRLDRETAGVMLFSKDKSTRALYNGLFVQQKVTRLYEAIARLTDSFRKRRRWKVKTRIVLSSRRPLMENGSGRPNSTTLIKLLERQGNLGRFRLWPSTGKQHQLRLHLAWLGAPVQNDRYYPHYRESDTDDFSKPLMLLAKEIRFKDPVTKKTFVFRSPHGLPALKDCGESP
jgi:tRNA pseudouridine32 synthase/23S rRNA pseudouridine746 synthase